MHIRKLNSIRALAAIIVMVSHFSNATNWHNGLLGKGAGQIGVMLFFILSGFLMSYIYLVREFSSPQVKKYILSRVARILPLFLFVTLASYLLVLFFGNSIIYDIKGIELVEHFFLMRGESVLWTISTELKFYLIFIFAWYIFHKNAVLLLLSLLIYICLTFFLKINILTGAIYGLNYEIRIFLVLPYFIAGTLLGWLYNASTINRKHTSSYFALSLIAILCLFPEVFNLIFEYRHKIWSDIHVLLTITMVFYLLLFFTPDDSPILANSLGDFLGKISYSMYLLHLPVLHLVNKHIPNTNELKFYIFLLTTIFISYISYKIIELPASNFIRKKYT